MPRRAAASSWMRPPERPAAYRVTARVSDMIHGWLDGKNGVPLLPGELAGSPDGNPALAPGGDPWHGSSLGGAELMMSGQAGSAAMGGETPLEDEASSPDPLAADAALGPARRPGPRTPRMEILALQAHERMEEERIRLAEDLTLLRRQAIGAWPSVETLTERVKLAWQALERARVPLTDAERSTRRLAEQDQQQRLEQLVIGRRDAAWSGRLRLAEQEYQAALAELAKAIQLQRTHQDAIRERIAVARAAARRQHELGSRRVATYLQQLVRTHEHGRWLNDLFMEHRVGPELPDWTRDQAEE